MTPRFYFSDTAIQAKQVKENTVVQIPEGEILLKAGGYVCTTPDNEVFIMNKEAFKVLFKEL